LLELFGRRFSRTESERSGCPPSRFGFVGMAFAENEPPRLRRFEFRCEIRSNSVVTFVRRIDALRTRTEKMDNRKTPD
jgi:hypothetical protein